MQSLFYEGGSFNQPLNKWNVSNVTNMRNMFAYCSFNQPLNNWDVSNVNTMERMFWTATYFNQPLNNWDVSNVTDMSGMFADTRFNQPLNKWNVSKVTDMKEMFEGANSFNQPLNNWNVSNVEDMEFMFCSARSLAGSFNQPLNKWNVSAAARGGVILSLSYGMPQSLSVLSYEPDTTRRPSGEIATPMTYDEATSSRKYSGRRNARHSSALPASPGICRSPRPTP